MKIHITRYWLQGQDACVPGLAAFEAEFPKGIEVDLDDKDRVLHLLRTSVCFRTYGGWLGAKLGLGHLDIAEADLARADLTRANLARADLTRANLAGADLSWANLAGADLSRANLVGADLTRANLARADMTRARIRRSDIVCSGQDPIIFTACVVKEDV